MNKFKLIASLGLVFLLVIATNMMDNHHFQVVKQTLKTVYEDRLLAKNYIYKISAQLQRKHLALLNEEGEELASETQAANDSLQVLIDLYATTRLTPKEAGQFSELRRNLDELSTIESRWTEGETVNPDDAAQVYSKIENNLAPD